MRIVRLMTLAIVAAAVLVCAPTSAQRSPQTQKAGNRFGLSQAPQRAKGAIRVATYNTLNLFDPNDDPNLQGEFDDINTPTSDDRCKALAAAIREMDADIIALQEVESLEALTWFRDTYLPGAGYTWLASVDVGYYRGVECSVMSRHEITRWHVWPDADLTRVPRPGPGWAQAPPEERLKFQRSPLYVEIKIDEDYTLSIFSVHHKAGRDFDYQREAEAAQICEYVNAIRKEDPARNIMVLGDFNAAPWDKSYRVYLEHGMIDTHGHRIIPRFEDAPQDEARLFKTHESNKVLDYILLNSAAHRELVLGSAFVLGTLYPGDQYDWRTDQPPPGYASDHYPVAIELSPHDLQ